MSGSTTELALKTAVDSDDTADYLTISLADSLRTVDALYSNVSGHNHAGAHQGAPIGLGAIPDGSITGAKIADGTITSAKIADGTVSTLDLAFQAVSQTVSAVGSTANPSTTSTTFVDMPEMTVNITCAGGSLLVWFYAAVGNATAAAYVQVALNFAGSDTLVGIQQSAIAGSVGHISGCAYLGVQTGAQTLKLRWATFGGGTAQANGILRRMLVMEIKR